MTECINRHSFR